MESYEQRPGQTMEEHLMELIMSAQAEMIEKYAKKRNLPIEAGAAEWVSKYAADFRAICSNPECFDGIERTHEATMNQIEKELYKEEK